jgi:hypothetical protein
MRWVKHLSTAHDDQAMGAILENHGPVGYGVYWLIVEEIAAAIDGDHAEPCAVKSLSSWAHLSFIPWQKLRIILGSLSDEGLIRLRSIGDRVEISVPNILKYRDEYQKKSGQTPDKLRTPKSLYRNRTDTEENITAASATNGTIVEQPETEPPAAAAAAAQKFPQAAKLIAQSFPGTDAAMVARIAQAARRHKPDATDAELLDALIRTFRREQRSAGLWEKTVSADFAARAGPANGHAPPGTAAAVCPECGGSGKILNPECDRTSGNAWLDWPEERIWLPCPRCREPAAKSGNAAQGAIA